MSASFPKSLSEFQASFPDEAACAAYIEARRWPKGFTCPRCGAKRQPYRFKAKPAVLRCRSCQKNVSLIAGTAMEGTHLSLSTWFNAGFLWALRGCLHAPELRRELRLKRHETAFNLRRRLIMFTPNFLTARGDWKSFRESLGLRVLALLVVGFLSIAAGYDRPSWRDEDHDCQNTRQEVIISSCQVTLSPSGCKVLTAVCLDPYSGAELSTDTPAQSIQVDHLFPASEAWKRRKWTQAAFADFYNDQRNLLATRSRYNGQKSDRMPDEWCPVNRAIRPVLARKFRRIAKAYGLPLTPAEERGLKAWNAGLCVAGALMVGK